MPSRMQLNLSSHAHKLRLQCVSLYLWAYFRVCVSVHFRFRCAIGTNFVGSKTQRNRAEMREKDMQLHPENVIELGVIEIKYFKIRLSA